LIALPSPWVTTWAFVAISPRSLTTKPEPTPPWGSPPSSSPPPLASSSPPSMIETISTTPGPTRS
jgi:hypothetical protein